MTIEYMVLRTGHEHQIGLVVSEPVNDDVDGGDENIAETEVIY